MNNNYVPIKDQDGFYRDSTNKSIINTNKKDFEVYLNNRRRMTSDKQRIDDLEVKVDSLKNDIGDIKDLLLKIVDK